MALKAAVRDCFAPGDRGPRGACDFSKLNDTMNLERNFERRYLAKAIMTTMIATIAGAFTGDESECMAR